MRSIYALSIAELRHPGRDGGVGLGSPVSPRREGGSKPELGAGRRGRQRTYIYVYISHLFGPGTSGRWVVFEFFLDRFDPIDGIPESIPKLNKFDVYFKFPTIAHVF